MVLKTGVLQGSRIYDAEFAYKNYDYHCMSAYFHFILLEYWNSEKVLIYEYLSLEIK